MSKLAGKTVVFNQKKYRLDAYDYLAPEETWDEDFAKGMAERNGIYSGLSEDHWKVIRYLRKQFLENQTVPFVVTACIDNRMRLGKMKSLFPSGYHRGACKIAGINYEFICKTNPLLTYENYTTLRANYKINEIGFLEDTDQWDANFALLVLHEHGLAGKDLNEKQREIISFLRSYYKRTKTIPIVYETCRTSNVTLEQLRDLFGGSYRRGACRAAGLPFFA